ncbi:hypothetical protein OG563_47030 [Nocardia vinacea]|uniref:Uncharacterized protein n=1 Tax=Nocardia vinacea TaxID=96468 RepID=A0ABZ1YW70_9NOCA|nr:hypothetical protein [Nocardia vinacea]
MAAERTDARIAGRAVAAGLAAWFLATALSQHPHPMFQRLRQADPTALLIPNWRFFAPEPARSDFHVLYRLDTTGSTTAWTDIPAAAPRIWRETVWFPRRRHDKALFDICADILDTVANHPAVATRTSAYTLLREHVRRAITTNHPDGPPCGFQFLIATDTGHDTGHEPDCLLISEYIPWTPERQTTEPGSTCVQQSGRHEGRSFMT